jgi:hypothetical protein
MEVPGEMASSSAELGIDHIDLNRASTAYLNNIGFANAMAYNLVPADHTHLNPLGSLLFGNMVGISVDKAVVSKHGYSIEPYTHANETGFNIILEWRRPWLASPAKVDSLG